MFDWFRKMWSPTPFVEPDCKGTGQPPKVVILYPEGAKIIARVCRVCDRATVTVLLGVVLAHKRRT